MRKNKKQGKETSDVYDCMCWSWYWSAVRWYRLKPGEIIEEGDFLGVIPGNGTVEWSQCTEIGKPAPDPKDLTDRTYRRVTCESPSVQKLMKLHQEYHCDVKNSVDTEFDVPPSALKGKFAVEWSQKQKSFHVDFAEATVFERQFNEAKAGSITDWRVVGIFNTSDEAFGYCDHLRKTWPDLFTKRD